MDKILDCIDFPALLINLDYKIRRCTPQLETLFHPLDGWIGRSILDLPYALNYPNIESDIKKILNGAAPINRSIETASGHRCLVTLSQFRVGTVVEGVVLLIVELEDQRTPENTLRHTDLSKRKKNQESFSSIAEKLQNVLSHIPNQVFWKNKDLIYEGCSEEFARIVGLANTQDVIGKTDFDFNRDSTHAESYQEYDRKIMQEDKGVIDLEEAFHRADGSEGYVLTSKVPLHDDSGEVNGILGICTDISARVNAEKDLERALKKLEFVTEGSNAGFWLWDIGENMAEWDDHFFTMLGYQPQEFSPSFDKFISLLHPEDVELTKKKINQHLEEDMPFDLEYRWLTQSGDYKWYRGVGKCVRDQNGVPLSMAGAVFDIHYMKQAEENLIRSNRDLEHFAYVASHDLRAPLRHIIGFIAVLRDELDLTTLNDESLQALHFIESSAAKMDALIIDLLEFSKIDIPDGKIEAFDAKKLVSDTLTILNDEISEKNAEVTVHPLPQICGSPRFIKQLFQNLIENSLKYQKAGASPKIEISSEENEISWTFHIADNGIGIADDKQEAIFKIFSRLHNDGEYSGTGVGLAVCKKIVELHGGAIWVNSQAGAGSTFSFTISKQHFGDRL